jgi:DNA-binding transcriptional regulator YdaS (Cro superfamily)
MPVSDQRRVGAAELLSDLCDRARAVVARAAGVSIETIDRWAAGETAPDLSQAESVERATGGMIRVEDWPIRALVRATTSGETP